jgi:hypothetical protein
MVMIDLDMNRIIGDFLEINAEISYNESITKGFFKKLSMKSKCKKQRKRLVELLEDFVRSDYILTRDNIYEAFVYFYDSKDIYTPKYLKVFKPDNKEDDMSSRIEGLINYKHLMCLIHLDSDRNDFDLNVKYNDPIGELSKISVTRTELKNDFILSAEVADINKYLKAEIGDFILSQIEPYMKGETK